MAPLAWKRIDDEDLHSIEGYDGSTLRAVATIWKRQRRTLTAAFGGSSMEPTIRAGERVTIRCTDDCQVGDVIVFVFRDQVAVHRLVAIHRRQRWLVTCGDNRTLPDEPITSEEAIVGVVTAVEREGSFVPLDGPPRRRLRGAIVGLLRGLTFAPEWMLRRLLRLVLRGARGLRARL